MCANVRLNDCFECSKRKNACRKLHRCNESYTVLKCCTEFFLQEWHHHINCHKTGRETPSMRSRKYGCYFVCVFCHKIFFRTKAKLKQIKKKEMKKVLNKKIVCMQQLIISVNKIKTERKQLHALVIFGWITPLCVKKLECDGSDKDIVHIHTQCTYLPTILNVFQSSPK